MEAVLGFQDVLEVITNDYEQMIAKMDDAQAKEVKKRNYKALFILHQCVDANNYEKISGIKNAKKAWDTLEQAYAGAEKLKKVRLQTLKRQYELLAMEVNESVGAYFNRVLVLVNQMKSCGKKISDKSIIAKILRTLPTKFDVIAVSIEETKDLDTLKLEELQGSLEAFEMRHAGKESEKSGEQALQTHTKSRMVEKARKASGRERKASGKQRRASGVKTRIKILVKTSLIKDQLTTSKRNG